MKTALFIALGIFTAGYLAAWATYARRLREQLKLPSLLECGIGLVTNFFTRSVSALSPPPRPCFDCSELCAMNRFPAL